MATGTSSAAEDLTGWVLERTGESSQTKEEQSAPPGVSLEDDRAVRDDLGVGGGVGSKVSWGFNDVRGDVRRRWQRG